MCSLQIYTESGVKESGEMDSVELWMFWNIDCRKKKTFIQEEGQQCKHPPPHLPTSCICFLFSFILLFFTEFFFPYLHLYLCLSFLLHSLTYFSSFSGVYPGRALSRSGYTLKREINTLHSSGKTDASVKTIHSAAVFNKLDWCVWEREEYRRE